MKIDFKCEWCDKEYEYDYILAEEAFRIQKFEGRVCLQCFFCDMYSVNIEGYESKEHFDLYNKGR